jgi:hypothetical protein
MIKMQISLKYKTFEYYGWAEDSDKILNRFDKESALRVHLVMNCAGEDYSMLKVEVIWLFHCSLLLNRKQAQLHIQTTITWEAMVMAASDTMVAMGMGMGTSTTTYSEQDYVP